MANFVSNKNVAKTCSISSASKSYATQPLRPITSLNQWKIGKRTGGQAASFLVKIIALETVRRFSRARCPFIWTGLQALQVVCYPPIKWIECWKPFRSLIKGMQMLSRPLLVISIVNALSDHSDSRSSVSDDTENSQNDIEPQLESQSHLGSPSLQGNNSTRTSDENPQGLPPADWMEVLHEELQNQGISLPERINKYELRRYNVAANGDLSSLISSLKRTIRWRETYRLLSGEELEMWSNLVFWHGFDLKHRPCLIVRLGLACTTLKSQDRPSFVQAIVSQVEHGILHLVDPECPQITVLVDCHGLTPLRVPMQMMRYCCNILQDHFPNILGGLIVIRLPPVVRVIAQTFIKVLKPLTKQKLRIESQTYQKVLSELFETLPSYLGGACNCSRCTKLGRGRPQILDSRTNATEHIPRNPDPEDLPLPQPTDQCDMILDSSFSRTLRAAVVGILIILVFVAFIEGIYDPESRPILLP